jgi:hypothetical protein
MKGAATADVIIKELTDWPMVTVLNEEHDALRSHHGKPPAQRYKDADIEVVERPSNGWDE